MTKRQKRTKRVRRVRRGSKPSSCPYCHSSNVSAHAGFWECHDCGQSGSY